MVTKKKDRNETKVIVSKKDENVNEIKVNGYPKKRLKQNKSNCL